MTTFNAAQQQAIEHESGPMIVVAGPGSGKTTVLTHRIAHLVAACHAAPGSILVITFTNAAAREMERRWQKLRRKTVSARAQQQDVTFGTFHSVFLHILREYGSAQGRTRSPRLADPKETLAILRAALEKSGPARRLTSDYYDHVLHEIGRLKNGMSCSDPEITKFRRLYDSEMARRGMIDFDDMLTGCLDLLHREPGVLAALRRRYSYLMVDEFQDINPVQFEIIRLLAAPRNNLFIVGDDDQSIYAFRGSDPSIMLSFRTIYPDAAFTELSQNYRSSGRIVRASAKLIRHNRKRFKKHLSTMNAAGPPLYFRKYRDPWEEAGAVLASVSLLPAGYSAAILFRTHKAGYEVSRLYEELMQEAPSAAGSFFSRHTDREDLREALKDKDVRLMTFHASKGLEFDAVYIIRAEDEVTPGKGAGPVSRGKAGRDDTDQRMQEALWEERRMFYVAMTRAREHLEISWTRYNGSHKNRRSRFLREVTGFL